LASQLRRVFALRLVENARTALGNLPVTDDQHIVGQAAHERQIVGHQQQRNAARPLHTVQEFDDRRLHRNVQRSSSAASGSRMPR